MKFVLVLLCILLVASLTDAQTNYRFTYRTYEQIPIKKIQTHHKDSLALKTYLTTIRHKAIDQGYLLFSIDSLKYTENEASCSISFGPKFKNAHLSVDDKYRKYVSSSVAITEKLISNLAFSPKDVTDLLQKIEKNLLNQGFPFATVQLDSIHFQNEELFAHVHITENRKISWGEIVIKGNNIINNQLLQSYIHIQTGDLYQEDQLKNISNQLKQIPFITESRPFELLFHEDKVDLYLYLISKPISLITGVLGLQPTTKINSTTYALTGDVRMKLVNILKKAESFDLQWRNLQANTQSLKTNVSFPTLFRSAFGLDGQFQLYKKDSTFLELKSSLGIQYLLKNGNTLKMFYRNYQSSLLSGGQSNPTILQLANINTNYYGLSIYKQTIDYLPCPTKGYVFQLEGAIGIRNKQDSILHTPTKTDAGKIEYTFNTYYALRKRHVIKFSNAVEAMFTTSFASNELIRFGGMATQRGFKEEELRATSRAFVSLEYRFLLDQNSFLFLFYDQSWYENKLATVKYDKPYGFGGGLTFGTQLGLFSISYALGSQLNNPILLSNGNIHFGYISYF